MIGQRLGYVRVSAIDQNPERQLAGVPLDRVFTDRASGKDTNRPQLLLLLSYARDGDVVIVHSMDRLARNLDDLRRLVRELVSKGCRVEFVTEGLVFGDEASPMAQLLLSVMGAFAEFERSLIRERQLEGIALAKGRGVYRGRAPALKSWERGQALARIAAGEAKSAVARSYGIHRSTLARYLAAAPPARGQ